MKRGAFCLVILIAVLLFWVGIAAAEQGVGTNYRALMIGVDMYPIEMPGGNTDATRIAAMLQSANEGGAFYQAPLIKTDVAYEDVIMAFEQVDFWGVERTDVTFFFYSGAAELVGGGASATLLLRDSGAMRLEEFSQMIAAVPGTKIVVLNLVYPNEKMRKTDHTEKELVALMADTATRALANAQPTGSSGLYAMCFTSGSDMLNVVNSIKDMPFGLSPYFLSLACGFDYEEQRPCELFADTNADSAITLDEAYKYISGKVGEFLVSGGLSDMATGIQVYPTGSDFPIFARRQNTQITNVELNMKEAELPTEKSLQLEVTLSPPNASDKSVSWASSDMSVATVDEHGTVSALRAGDAVISASAANGLTDFLTLKVRTVRYAESIKMSAESAIMFEESTLQLKLLVEPVDANEPIIYESSNEEVATVSQTGVVTAVSLGETQITASTDGEVPLTAICKVTVAEKGHIVELVQLRDPLLSMFEGSTKKLDIHIQPEDAEDKSVIWNSSDETVATVTQDGVVTAVSKGAATITVTASSGISAECKLTVRSAVIEFKKQDISVEMGGTERIEYRFIPEDSKIDIEWEVADEEIAALTDGDMISGKKIGTTTITAKLATGLETTLIVTVTEVPIKNVKFSKKTLKLVPGQEELIETALEPEGHTAFDLTWTSSNPQVATVNEEGKVFALADGKAEITAAAKSGKSAVCRIEVKSVKVKKVELDKKSIALALVDGADTDTLVATTTPENAQVQGVVWKSENESIAQVSDAGVVTARAEGKTTIRATSQDGGAYADCKVTVAANRVSYDKPLSGTDKRVYISANRIYYDNLDNLVIEMYFLNKTKEDATLPKAGTLYLQRSDGTEMAVLSIAQGNKELKPGKSGTLAFKVPLSQAGADRFRNLDLRSMQATIRTAEEDAEIKRILNGTPTPTEAPQPEVTEEPTEE